MLTNGTNHRLAKINNKSPHEIGQNQISGKNSDVEG